MTDNHNSSKTLTELATEMAETLGVDTGSFEVHCRDGAPGEVKVHTTIKLEKKTPPQR